jgi:hypothetical protein
MAAGEQISLPFDGRYMMFEVDKLETAMLILMDLPPGEESLTLCAHRLQAEHGWTDRADYILYPLGAAIALQRGILMGDSS